jgi:pyrimidine operon attenuation protein / uracil phosphoribosyltransferase
VAERERRTTPPYGGVFMARTEVMDADDVRRATWRMAHEILERNQGTAGLALVGLQTGGVPLAASLAGAIGEIDGQDPPVGTLDVAFYRDDIGIRPVLPQAVTDIPFELDGATVVLVDDVLFTGRTIRAALDAVTDYGRPRCMQLAVMVDRGHRELPIRPDYVGKNLPTRRDEVVNVTTSGVELGEMVRGESRS